MNHLVYYKNEIIGEYDQNGVVLFLERDLIILINHTYSAFSNLKINRVMHTVGEFMVFDVTYTVEDTTKGEQLAFNLVRKPALVINKLFCEHL